MGADNKAVLYFLGAVIRHYAFINFDIFLLAELITKCVIAPLHPLPFKIRKKKENILAKANQ